MGAMVGGIRFRAVTAGSKKEARRRAAQAALLELAEQGRLLMNAGVRPDVRHVSPVQVEYFGRAAPHISSVPEVDPALFTGRAGHGMGRRRADGDRHLLARPGRRR